MPTPDLPKIERLILLGHYRVMRKAELEHLRGGLLQMDVLQSIINGSGIKRLSRLSVPVAIDGRP